MSVIEFVIFYIISLHHKHFTVISVNNSLFYEYLLSYTTLLSSSQFIVSLKLQKKNTNIITHKPFINQYLTFTHRCYFSLWYKLFSFISSYQNGARKLIGILSLCLIPRNYALSFTVKFKDCSARLQLKFLPTVYVRCSIIVWFRVYLGSTISSPYPMTLWHHCLNSLFH